MNNVFAMSFSLVRTVKCLNFQWTNRFFPQRPWINRGSFARHATWVENSVQSCLGKIELHRKATWEMSQVDTRSFVRVHRVILLTWWGRLDIRQPAARLIRRMCRPPVTLKELAQVIASIVELCFIQDKVIRILQGKKNTMRKKMLADYLWGDSEWFN